jgi:hypothetical protein
MEKVNDYKLVKAERDGFDFNLRVLRPWAVGGDSLTAFEQLLYLRQPDTAQAT